MKKLLLIILILSQSPLNAAIVEWKQLMVMFQQLNELRKHGGKLQQQVQGIANVKDEINKRINESKKLMSGKYTYGSKYIVPGLDRWEKDINDWSKLSKNYQHKGSDPVNKIVRDIEKTYKITKGDKIFKSSYQKEQAAVFDDLSETSIASNAIATQTYNDVDKDIKVLEELKTEIDKSDSQKKTLDLIARVNIQKAIIQAKSNRINAVQTKMVAIESQKEITDAKWVNEALDWHKTQ